MNEFDIANVRWWNIWKCNQGCEIAKDGARIVIDRARALVNFEYEPSIGKALADAEDKVTEALFAIQTARREYEQLTKPKLVAAE